MFINSKLHPYIIGNSHFWGGDLSICLCFRVQNKQGVKSWAEQPESFAEIKPWHQNQKEIFHWGINTISKFNQWIIKHLFITQGGTDRPILCWAPSRNAVMEASLTLPYNTSPWDLHVQTETERIKQYACQD